MTHRTYSARLTMAGLFSDPSPAYDTFMPYFQPGGGHGEALCMTALTTFASNSPCAIAFVDGTNSDAITIAHTPRVVAPRITGGPAGPFDRLTIALIGDREDQIMPIVLPQAAFEEVTTRVLDDPLALEAALTAANPLDGPHAAATPATSEVDCRRAIILPCEWAGLALMAPEPTFTSQQFYDLFLAPIMADPATRARYAPIINWWRCASTLTTVGGNDVVRLRLTPGVPNNAAASLVLTRWTASHVFNDLAGVNAPGTIASSMAVTTAINASTTAITTLDTNIQAANATRAAEEAARRNVTFTQRHGASIAALVHRITNSADDTALPEIHRSMASYKDKSRDFATLNMALYTRVNDLATMNEINMPKATSHLINLFRSHNLIATGIDMGEGFSPFSMVCNGHPQSKDVLELADKQSAMEAGDNAISLSDATSFTTKDVRFPRTQQQAVDKLRAWSVAIDVYMGPTHTLAAAVRGGVELVVPHIQALETVYSSNPRLAMMICLRITLWFQNVVFLWLRKKREMAVGDPTLPDFDGMVDAMRMHMHENYLPRLPDHWMTTVKSQLPNLFPDGASRIRGGGGTEEERSNPQANSVTNEHVNAGLKRRWEASGHDRLKDMIDKYEGGSPVYPKLNGEDVCFSWACKGKCKDNCPRKNTHKRFSNEVVASVHAFMDKCGVPSSA